MGSPRELDTMRTSKHSVRKELKIRPGFTPQEDVGRFKGSRQKAAESNALPKGHIIGWVAPSSSQKPAETKPKVSTVDANGQPLSKAALKNAKRKAKRDAERANAPIPSAFDDEDEEEEEPKKPDVEDAPDAWDEEGDGVEDLPAAVPPSATIVTEPADTATSESAAVPPAPAPTPAQPEPAASPASSTTPAKSGSVASSPKPPTPSRTPSSPSTPTRTAGRQRMQPGVEGLRRALGSLNVSK